MSQNHPSSPLEAAISRHPSSLPDTAPTRVGDMIPEVIRRLAKLHDITEDEVIARLRGKAM